jgi:hypothetical protein
LQKAKEHGEGVQKIPEAVEADKEVAVSDELLEKAGVARLGPLFEEEKINLWALKKLVANEQAWRQMGLKWGEVEMLKDVL